MSFGRVGIGARESVCFNSKVVLAFSFDLVWSPCASTQRFSLVHHPPPPPHASIWQLQMLNVLVG